MGEGEMCSSQKMRAAIYSPKRQEEIRMEKPKKIETKMLDPVKGETKDP
jgi:hypothetical protein